MAVSRAYNRFHDIPFGLIKKESETERLADEIFYYKTIQRDINKSIFFPRLIASGTGITNWLLLEKYGYRNLGEYLISSEEISWDSIFDNLLSILIQFGIFTDTAPVNYSHAREMYIDKTEREYENFVNSRPDLSEMFNSPTLTINGITYQNFEFIWSFEIQQYLYNHLPYVSTMIHGDFCFSNILYGSSDIFKFIDPRGSFGKQGIFGDMRYDIAKLYHSVDGKYEHFINDKFEVRGSSGKYTLDFSGDQKCLQAALSSFEYHFLNKDFNKKEIKAIEGTIYVGMCARHYDDKDRQLAMYLTGIKLLNEAASL